MLPSSRARMKIWPVAAQLRIRTAQFSNLAMPSHLWNMDKALQLWCSRQESSKNPSVTFERHIGYSTISGFIVCISNIQHTNTMYEADYNDRTSYACNYFHCRIGPDR